jgi:L-xylulokinase
MEGTPVAVGMFDVNACALAMGVVEDNCMFMITGTWNINAYVAKKPVTDGSILFNSIYFIPGYSLIEEGSPTSAGFLEWAIGALYPDEAQKMGKALYARLDESVQKLAPEASWATFLPFVHGAIGSDKIGSAWLGINASTHRAELLPAVYEGVAFAHRAHVERLKKNCGSYMRFRLASGVVNSAVWSQMSADVLGEPLEIMQTKELGAQGAAISAGIAAGLYPDYAEAMRRCERVDRVRYPDPARAAVYVRKYGLFTRRMRMVLEEPETIL